MPDGYSLLAVLARFLYVASACVLTGTFAFLVLVAAPAVRTAGPLMHERFEALRRRLVSLAAWSLVLVMMTGLADFARQALVATSGHVAAALTPQTLGALLTGTRYGDIWLVRHLIWLLLAGVFVFRGPERRPSDRLAFTLAGLTLSGAALAVGAASGHAASAPEPTATAIAIDALHLLAAGLWSGALVPLVVFIRWAARDGPEAQTVMVGGVRRFSMLGLLSVAVMLATGAYSAVQQVGSVPALLGTTYGHWLVAKLMLLVPLLAIALVNRVYVLPHLERSASGRADRADAARALAGQLGRFVALEGLCVAAILVAVAVLGLTTPARHEPIAWPLPFRLATVLPPLVAEAYPTTYARPTVPYTTASIVRGQALYHEHCESCHGRAGTGDGAAASRAVSPPDLTATRITERTVGDLFWRTSHTGQRLAAEERWDVVNFLRTLTAAEVARDLSALVSTNPAIVAPDIAYTIGVGSERSLREHRGQLVVLLVFFRLPESLGRLSRLSRTHFDFRTAGVEILAVPLQDAGRLYRALGPRPLLFPFVIEGAEDAVAAYRLFAQERSTGIQSAASPLPIHMEMLVDRRGYLRARWLPQGSPDAAGGWNDPTALSLEISRLTQEPRSAPVLGEHIH